MQWIHLHFSSGQSTVLYHRKVAWNNFPVYLIYDTALLNQDWSESVNCKGQLFPVGVYCAASCDTEQGCRLRGSAPGAPQQQCQGWGLLQSSTARAAHLTHTAHNTPYSNLSTEHSLQCLSFFLPGVYKSNSCKAVLALSYVFAHFCWLKSHFLLGKLLRKVYFLHSYKLLA